MWMDKSGDHEHKVDFAYMCEFEKYSNSNRFKFKHVLCERNMESKGELKIWSGTFRHCEMKSISRITKSIIR